MDKRFLAILGVIAAIFIGIAVFAGGGDDKNSGNGGNSTAQATNHTFGEGAKSVTFLEYGDFQCSVCLVYEPVLQQVRQKYAKDIKFQFRNLPLVQIHANAFAASRAAEAAGKQNKYWEMHDLLYQQTNWQSWTNSNNARSIFEGYAKQLSLDMEKFKRDYASDAVNDAINADLNAFGKTGQEMATPSFFLNGRYVKNSELSDTSGNPSLDKLSQLIDAEIAKQSSGTN